MKPKLYLYLDKKPNQKAYALNAPRLNIFREKYLSMSYLRMERKSSMLVFLSCLLLLMTVMTVFNQIQIQQLRNDLDQGERSYVELKMICKPGKSNPGNIFGAN